MYRKQLAFFSVFCCVFFAVTAYATPQCLQKQPLDCSVPWIAKQLSPHTLYFSGKFSKACMRHDYCYRHGYATYGYSREHCDKELRRRTKNICKKVGVGSVITLGGSNAACLAASEEFYQAVRKFGKGSYNKERSTCCEYAGKAKMKKCGGAATSPSSGGGGGSNGRSSKKLN